MGRDIRDLTDEEVARKRRRAEARSRDSATYTVAIDSELRPVGRRPSGLKALRLLLTHPTAFWRGGVAASLEAECPLITHPDYARRLDLSMADYLSRYFDKRFMRSLSWMGVPTLKVVTDLWIYQEILFRTRPDVVLEIGSHCGGSTLFLAHMLDALGHGRVLSVDVSRAVFTVRHDRIVTVTGDSADKEVIDRVRDIVDGQKAMVIHDADHSYSAVKRDLGLYAPMVGVGQYLVVEDGVIDLFNPDRFRFERYPKGPLRAIEEFVVEQEGRFVIDETCERFALTANPRGFLKRVEGRDQDE